MVGLTTATATFTLNPFHSGYLGGSKYPAELLHNAAFNHLQR